MFGPDVPVVAVFDLHANVSHRMTDNVSVFVGYLENPHNDIYERGAAYNMPRAQCDGQDVFEVQKSVQEAVNRARKESLPTLIEARTYRYMGHSMSDPGNYRTRAEIEKYQERDPIKLFTATLKENKVLTDGDLSDMEAAIKAQIEKALRFAEESPEPDPKELYTNVYANK